MATHLNEQRQECLAFGSQHGNGLKGLGAYLVVVHVDARAEANPERHAQGFVLEQVFTGFWVLIFAQIRFADFIRSHFSGARVEGVSVFMFVVMSVIDLAQSTAYRGHGDLLIGLLGQLTLNDVTVYGFARTELIRALDGPYDQVGGLHAGQTHGLRGIQVLNVQVDPGDDQRMIATFPGYVSVKDGASGGVLNRNSETVAGDHAADRLELRWLLLNGLWLCGLYGLLRHDNRLFRSDRCRFLRVGVGDWHCK